MAVKIWRVNPEAPEKDAIEEAAAIIVAGGLVAFPTETVYGLGANAFNEEAVRKIFAAKERPAWDPLIVHISRPDMVKDLAAVVPETFWRLAERLMPGPLTVVLPKRPKVPDAVTAGLPTVAIRMPKHPVALALIEAAGVPIAAPSANRFGRPSPTRAEHVLADLGDRIDGILDAGPTRVGVESTVVDLTATPPTILRPGGVSRETLAEILGEVAIAETPKREGEPMPSPGMTHRHYAPAVPLRLTEPSPQAVQDALLRFLAEHPQGKVGLLLPTDWREWVTLSERVVIFDWGEWGDWATMARRLFEGLRWLERQGVVAIFAPLPPPIGLGLALRDRLIKASGSDEIAR
jgi:L-threonylcarbamoyladenylate synthase